MDFKDIKLGKQYWCVFKASVVNPEQKEYPDFLMHVGLGYVTSKGAQKEVGSDNGTSQLFVEIAGQRIKASHVFESPEDAIDMLEVMMDEMRRGLGATNAVPEQS